MQPKLSLKINENCKLDLSQKIPYRELIGSLMYIMLGSRPDLCYCITYFSQFQNCFTQEHWIYLKNVLRYLKLTENYGLKFYKSKNQTVKLESYVDADFANDINNRKSVSRYIVKLNKNVIQWKSKKQTVVSLSSAESEYIALSQCVSENLFIGQMLNELLNINVYPVTVYEDNQSCIRMASTLEVKRTKHIDIKYHFVRDCVANDMIRLSYVSTNDQEADMLTKALDSRMFCYFRDKLKVLEI